MEIPISIEKYEKLCIFHMLDKFGFRQSCVAERIKFIWSIKFNTNIQVTDVEYEILSYNEKDEEGYNRQRYESALGKYLVNTLTTDKEQEIGAFFMGRFFPDNTISSYSALTILPTIADLNFRLIHKNCFSIEYIGIGLSSEMVTEAVRQNPYCLRYVTNPTTKLVNIAKDQKCEFIWLYEKMGREIAPEIIRDEAYEEKLRWDRKPKRFVQFYQVECST
jgi:hypothetical protein